MSNDDPNPLSDVRRGLGLLLRAARTAARKLPTKDLEDVVATSAREVGRAIENVAGAIEREMFGKGGQAPPPKGAPPSGSPAAPSEPRDTIEKPEPKDEPPKAS
jgi:hypothetical protein